MDIIIVSQYLRDIENFEENNSRFVYLAKMLANSGEDDIEIVTSDFYHRTKKHFLHMGLLDNIKVTMVHEPGYLKNVCLKRFYSHMILAKSVRKYLMCRKKPDLIYCAVPSLDVANVVASYCKKNSVRFIIDIQDLWPEAFRLVFNIPVISNFIYAPMEKKANFIYSQADEIVAVSKTYVDRALKVSLKCESGNVVFLGTNLKAFDANKIGQYNDKSLIKKEDEVWLGYVGTLGHSYDLIGAMDALRQLKNKSLNYKFIIMGQGPLRQQFEEYALKYNLPVVFTGMLQYKDMVKVLCQCDIAINTISHGAAQSIINKHGDYMAAGLPIVSTQENEEFRDLVEKYQLGINCENGNIHDLANNLLLLIENSELRKEMGKKSRLCAEQKFDRDNTYQTVIDLIKKEF